VRDRLKAAGYDPALADPFFGQAQATTGQGATSSVTGAAQATFVRALSELGILASGTQQPEEQKVRELDEATGNRARAAARYGGVFGKDVFSGISTAFDPVTSGPVDPAYRLGVGDQVQVIVTGQVELAYQLELRRDGTVVIPQVGQIELAGLTLDGARALLKARMGRSYSGLNTGEANLDLTVSRIRANSVFVIGEVERPGSYQVNALSTVFYALAHAGGPTTRGSFRTIEVRRGGKPFRTIDLYDYLLRGDASDDIRTQQGDIIFVPLNERAVAITGAVRRPGIFELKPRESFTDLIGFAGGLLTSAALDRVQIDRVLPPELRKPGFERVKIDVPLHGRLDTLASVALHDADIVTVFSIGDVRRNTVAITGAVFQPGQYELKPGMTLDSLVANAQGLLPFALADRIKLDRLVLATGQVETYSLNLADSTARRFPLAEFDEITVLDARTAYPPRTITVTGAVVTPATRPYILNETLKDAIERAGGLREEAATVTVARRRVGQAYTDTTSLLFPFTISTPQQVPAAAGTFVLEPDDHIIVRTAPGYRSQRFVTLEGLFEHTGLYAITENHDRISDLVRRAGGPLPGAYANSFRLSRDGKPVAVDFDRALKGDRVHDVLLLNGDVLSIGPDPRTVFVNGQVARPSFIVYRPGLSVADYIELAGGPTEKGMANRAVVEYPAGYSERVRRVALFFHAAPPVVSGATITVPERPESKTNASELWARVFQGATALASIVVAYAAVHR
jgi:protein involved in polysaccharide export with SLBB domain